MKYLPEGGENLFQRIKRLVVEYEAQNGAGSSINIAVGEPDTTPPKALRELVAQEVLRDENANHTYWDNRTSGALNANFVKLNTGIDISSYSHISSLVIPGEKPMLGLLPIATGANRSDVALDNSGYMVNAPAYDLISTWSEYLGEESFIWPIYSHDDFKLRVSNMPEGKLPRMIVTVKPGNPCPVGASREEWVELIEYCIENNIRLVNDGAYTAVVHKNHVSLTEVAKDYPKLDWLELFSMSKTYSACGWRLGVAVGSEDFVSEFTKIKGNADSGAFGPLILGMDKYLETPQAKVDANATQELY
ncbi:aminotransferase class I/II-fold pyridoxal phosphate-dependent enzyme, partial [Candidatus Gracilibacteria bacterium]|nr:aminotransferase class I/II-fold pyridoxal phosphate-dependent enzyme [Candidatus Gracilibacteria bacterium]